MSAFKAVASSSTEAPEDSVPTIVNWGCSRSTRISSISGLSSTHSSLFTSNLPSWSEGLTRICTISIFSGLMRDYPAKKRLNTSKITGACLEVMVRIMQPWPYPRYTVAGNFELVVSPGSKDAEAQFSRTAGRLR
jgi:hypothetical protein